MPLRIISLVLLLFCIASAAGQMSSEASDNDSLIFKKADEAFSLAFKNSDSAMILAREALEQAAEIKSDRAGANAYNALGWAYMHKGYLDTSILFLQKARQIFSTLKNESDIIRVDIHLAEVYTKQSKISEAIRYLLQADSLSVKSNNIPFQTNVRRQLAIVYREAGDYKKSADYFIQALTGFEKQEDYFRYASTGVSLSILYRNMKLMDSSLSILKRCLAMAKKRPDNHYQVAMVEEHLAESYFGKENFAEALNHFHIAYNIFQQLNNKADLAYEAFCVGRTLVRLKRFSEAEKYLLQSYAINDTLKMHNYQLDASHELASLYQQTGAWQKAFQYLQKATELKDSLDLAAQVEQTNELKEKFETEKKESEIALLKTKNQLAETDNRRTRLLQYIFILLFAASLVIGWLLLARFRMKRKLQEQVLRNQIAGDLHDDIGSVLSSIDISSRIALDKKDNPEIMTNQLIKIRQYARRTMESMSDIVWSINPLHDNLESVIMRMREFAAEMCEPQQIQLQMDVPSEIETIKLDSDKRKNLFLVFKEAVNNAAKYSQCSSLTISFSKGSNHSLLMKIKDDGKGFDEQTVKKGNGLRNMRARADNLKAELGIISEPDKGTYVQLRCPL